MRISDRTLGLLTLLVIAGIGITIAALMIIKSNRATTRVIALFDEMGSLQPEDPVTCRGFVIGKIGSVEWLDGKARVDILLNEPTILHQGTTLRNENYSIMGQRRLEMRVDRSTPVVDPDHVFIGEFEPGIAEAMHLMSKVRDQVIAIREIVFLLRDGDSLHPSIPQSTKKLLAQTQQILNGVDLAVRRTSPQIRVALNQVSATGRQVADIAEQADSAMTQIHRRGRLNIAEARALMERVQNSLMTLSAFLDHLERQPFYKELVYRQEILRQINSLIATLQGVLGLFTKEGGLLILDEQGKPRGLTGLSNINLFGKTAREKARLRQKEKNP